MVEEKKEKEFVKAQEMQLNEVELKVNRQNDEQVDKIIFHMSHMDRKIDITWKPKISKDSFEGGFKVNKIIPMERGLLPKKLVEMATQCSEKGHCKVKVNYHVWNTEQDGSPVTYRFITSGKTFDEWEVLDKGTEQEKIE